MRAWTDVERALHTFDQALDRCQHALAAVSRAGLDPRACRVVAAYWRRGQRGTPHIQRADIAVPPTLSAHTRLAIAAALAGLQDTQARLDTALAGLVDVLGRVPACRATGLWPGVGAHITPDRPRAEIRLYAQPPATRIVARTTSPYASGHFHKKAWLLAHAQGVGSGPTWHISSEQTLGLDEVQVQAPTAQAALAWVIVAHNPALLTNPRLTPTILRAEPDAVDALARLRDLSGPIPPGDLL